MIKLTKVVNELQKRSHSSFDINEYLFKEQLAFVNDENPFKVAVTSRRAGKSTSVAADLVMTALGTPECTALYITGTRVDAKKIVWGEVLKFNKKHDLKGIPNISELTVTYPNGSLVRLSGAKDDREIEKIRGQLPPVKKAFIDEAQSIRDSILVKLIDDVLEASLLDYAGSIILSGTPPAIPVGYLYRISHNLDDNGKPLPTKVWSTHHWTFFDNPFIAIKSKTTHQKLLERVLKRRGVGVDDPSIQREFFGKWVVDTNSLVYQYNENINHYDTLPKDNYTYILGIDLGFNDADALAVIAWNDKSRTTYLVHELITRKQTVSDLVEQVEAVRKQFDIAKIVVDTGGLGKKIAEELLRRYKIPVQAAEKVRKVEFIELFNDDLRTGRFKAKKSSRFAEDSMKVEWDTDKSTPDKKVISKRFHSDICEAALYAWRESLSFTYTAPIQKPVVGSREWEDELQEQALEHFLRIEKEDKGFNGDDY